MSAGQTASGGVAYLITSYALPHQVVRLARSLRAGSPAAPVLIHHDDRRSRLDAAALARIGAPDAWRPEVLRLADLERIVGSGADFARKFDMTVDAAVLDALDRAVSRSRRRSEV